MPSIMEPLPHVRMYRLIDYDDLDAARDGLMELSKCIGRDEQNIEKQRSEIAQRYGLKSMTENLLRLYSSHGIEAHL